MDICTFMIDMCTFKMDRCYFMMDRCTFMMYRCTLMMDRCTLTYYMLKTCKSDPIIDFKSKQRFFFCLFFVLVLLL